MKKTRRSPSSDRRARGSRKNNARTAVNTRRLVAQLAARMVAEQGISDYGLAKRKAAERLGLGVRAGLPRNSEIEEALAEHQRIFAGPGHAALQRQLRTAAREAMEFFAVFQPRLVGSVLNGTASEHSDVSLHLFADAPEQVVMQLIRNSVPYEVAERRMRLGRDRYRAYPVYRFIAGEVAIDATVFPLDGLRQAPYCPVEGRPIKRARLEEVEALLGGPEERAAGGGDAELS